MPQGTWHRQPAPARKKPQGLVPSKPKFHRLQHRYKNCCCKNCLTSCSRYASLSTEAWQLYQVRCDLMPDCFAFAAPSTAEGVIRKAEFERTENVFENI